LLHRSGDRTSARTPEHTNGCKSPPHRTTLVPGFPAPHPSPAVDPPRHLGVPLPPAPSPVTRTPKRTATKARAAEGAAVRPPISLVLIDDNRLLREGLAAMIHAQPGFRVLAAAADVDEALAKVREAMPDVVLLDFGLADHDSLALTATVSSRSRKMWPITCARGRRGSSCWTPRSRSSS
jgi:hypothetical protein